MEFSQQTQDASTGEAPASRNEWRQYERVKRRLAAQYGPGSEAYDEALMQYLEDAGL